MLTPSATLQLRLAHRIAAESGDELMLPPPPGWPAPHWDEVAPGIACELLANDDEKRVVSMLVRLARGGEYPPHAHAGVEELYLLHGELWIDERKLFSRGLSPRRGRHGGSAGMERDRVYLRPHHEHQGRALVVVVSSAGPSTGRMTHKQQNQTVLSGIEQLPWGAHACHVYRSREDLVERLVPYFAAGLRANEACLWITAGPLDARGAEELMVEAVPEFGACLAKGQIEIHDAKEWYSPGGRFDAASVVEVWLEREQQALRAGYSGLRLSGDTSWVERTARDDFMEYERRLGDAFRGRRLIALCTYSINHCSPEDAHEIARCHEFALARTPSSTTPAATLGDVLYGNRPKALVPERDWVALVRSVAGGDQVALHALYERAHRPVFTLAVRICGSRETAEEVTLDVFHDLWRRASGYDPANGTVLGWIMNQARSRAIDRLRFDQRKKRSDPDGAEPGAETEADISRDVLELKEQSAAVQAALVLLTPEERQAIETAFFHELTHVEVAARLNQPLGTIKTRIRSGLHKLRQALAAEVKGR